ncbi:hypothetical protein BBJ28_00011836 [Nothophytophthora sp. Chile5]|nr:hypothetical protein BBJ28_00011836 [Nothophytophthora sp. Chile5]
MLLLRKARAAGAALAVLTPLAVLALGEGAQRYDDSKKAEYAKQQLLAWRQAAVAVEPAAIEQQSEETGASAWLGSAPPKFPYLLAVSSGDNPTMVTNALLGGARVLGSYAESTRDTLLRMTAPCSAPEKTIHRIARRYSELKISMHGDVPEAFDPRVEMLATAEDAMMEALLDGLRDLRLAGDHQVSEEGDGGLAASSATPEAALPVFFLRDFDTLSEREAEKWLKWTHQVTSEGVAHVVLLTAAAVTPAKMRWLQTRHRQGLSATASDGGQDFVAILLRAAKDLIDASSAKEKLRALSAVYDLKLFPDMGSDNEDQPGHLSGRDDPSETDDGVRGLGSAAEVEVIEQTAGNWWSDLDAICQRLKLRGLDKMTSPEERMATTHEVCSGYLQYMEAELLAALHLDGSLVLSAAPASSNNAASSLPRVPSGANDQSAESQALSALEAWKCLETLAGVAPATGASNLVSLPQQLLNRNNERPLNCVNPVDALLPFNHRAEGEQKFLDLIDQQMLLLRPKVSHDVHCCFAMFHQRTHFFCCGMVAGSCGDRCDPM